MANSVDVNPTLPPNGPAKGSPFMVFWRRFGVFIVLLLVVVAFGAFEVSALLNHRSSIQRVLKWARSIPSDGTVALREIVPQLSGSPRQKIIDHEEGRRVIFTWPSLIGTYRLRARIEEDGDVIYLDTEPTEDEEFIRPILVSNAEGIRFPVPGKGPALPASSEETVNLLEATRTAFAAPKQKLLPGVLVFPMVDQDGKIIAAGPAVAATAQYSLVFTDHKRMALEPRTVRQVLVDADCWAPGAVLDEPKIARCLSMLGTAETYVLCRAGQQGVQWHVRLEIVNSKTDQRTEHEVDVAQLNLVPGVLAAKLFEHLGDPLAEAEMKVVAAPQFQTEQDAEAFSLTAVKTIHTMAEDDGFRQKILDVNPEWIAAWEYYLDRRAPPWSPTALMTPKSMAVQSALILPARPSPEMSNTEALNLLAFTCSLRGETSFHRQLMRSVPLQNRNGFADELIKIWQAENGSYEACVARAQQMMQLGPPAEVQQGISSAAMKDPATLQAAAKEQAARLATFYQQRFKQAQTELEQALKLVPGGWQAHAEMIRVADGLRAPWKEIEAHFDAALKASPHNSRAWNYLLATQRRYGPENGPDMYSLANRCLDSGLWQQGFPQQSLEIARGVAINFNTREYIEEELKNAAHWQVVEKCYRLAQEQPLSEFEMRSIRAQFAWVAAVSGRYADAAPAFDLLDKPTQLPAPQSTFPNSSNNLYMDPVEQHFKQRSEYERLRDLVRAKLVSDAK